IQYTNPAGYPPLEHSSRILANEGWQVLFLGTGAKGADNLTFPPHENITVYKIPFCEAGWRQKLHYFRYCFWVLIWVIRWQPTWIYASDILVCPIAYLLTFLPHSQVIYHEHDSPTCTPNTFFLRLCLKTRAKLANNAKFSILPNEERAKKFTIETNTDKQVFCVWNCPRLEEASLITISIEKQNKELWLLYHGSIVTERIPLTVIQALVRLPEMLKLRIIGYQTVGSTGYINKLQELAHDLNISHRLEIKSSMPRHELWEWCRKSDIGLALMPIISDDINLVSMVGASNKPFDYLACGLPLIVSDLPDWQKMYVDSGYGLACNPDDVDSIVKVLTWYWENQEEMRAMGERGRQKILDEWNYETQFRII
ncbi:glycosyltransferase, partial [Geminocystis sp. CENA526]|uniref:glycosyltransferase n=1 Tax=Geminocystis sp. CENA526 TaxID=1355871 RepID=UPI003D7016B9